MFKHLLSSIGIDGMTVDTLVNNNRFDTNERVEGVIHIRRDRHHIDHIELTLVERIFNDDDTSDFATYDHILEKVSIVDDGQNNVPFSFPVPTTIKSLNNQFFIITQLYIDGAVDAYDEDEIYFI
ncbi:sporulation protein [Macrococcus lamae]|uniref:Sporulation protein n=1 Tax=Macrococcus lamae TaxID=198484 RepID=A0A4R6BXU7_9STAP|nr:sporulation protein [Macrococcus lamae]TDM13301.1 hypothetical protein ERX29_01500 [Macrococcus lamae]